MSILEAIVETRRRRLVLTASDVVGHLACPHLTQLNRAVAEGQLTAPDREDPELELVARRGQEHERAQLDRFLAAGGQIVAIDSDSWSGEGLRAMEARTVEAMQAGADVIYQAGFFDGRWHGRADFLVKTRPVHPGCHTRGRLHTRTDVPVAPVAAGQPPSADPGLVPALRGRPESVFVQK